MPAGGVFTISFPANILNVSHHNFIAGGSDRAFIELTDLLTEKGHRVMPFCAQDSRNRPSEFAKYFPSSIDPENPSMGDPARFIYSTAARKSVNALLRDYPVDLAHLHIYYGKLTASILAPLRDAGIPVVQTLHEYKLVCPVYTLMSGQKPCEACNGGQFWKAIPRRCNRDSLARTMLSVAESYVSAWLGSISSVDHFIGVSDFVTRKMISLGLPPDRVSTIHNFVDTEAYRPSFAAGEYILYFGRLETSKGIYTLLEAFRDISGTRLVIAGSGSEADAVRAWVHDNDQHNVELAGFVGGDALQDLIRGAVCTVVPSTWYEPFGLTVLESMALGRPVVASRIGGIPEIITHEQDGLLVEAGNPAALREALLELILNPSRAREMGHQARINCERNFNRDRYYQQLMQVYRKAARCVSGTAADEQ